MFDVDNHGFPTLWQMYHVQGFILRDFSPKSLPSDGDDVDESVELGLTKPDEVAKHSYLESLGKKKHSVVHSWTVEAQYVLMMYVYVFTIIACLSVLEVALSCETLIIQYLLHGLVHILTFIV